MLPDIVYHYCNTDTFFKIVENKTLRLSDIEKSNDFLEKNWSIHQCLSHIRNLIEAGKRWETTAGYVLADAVEKEFSKYNRMILACCFSKQRDLLSQWRGYGDNGAGICLGVDAGNAFSKAYQRTRDFFSSKIDVLGDMKNLGYDIIRYDAGELCQIMEKLFDKYLEMVPQTLTMEQAAEKLVRLIYPALPYFKSPAFREELEYRFVYYPNLPAAPYIPELFSEEEFQEKLMLQKNPVEVDRFILQPMNYRERNRNLVSYRDICFNNLSHPFIRNITIGPRCPVDRETLKLFMELNGLHIDINDIYYSEVSYR